MFTNRRNHKAYTTNASPRATDLDGRLVKFTLSADATLVLPKCAASENGLEFVLQKSGLGNLTITANASNLLAGSLGGSTYVEGSEDLIHLSYDYTNNAWMRVDKKSGIQRTDKTITTDDLTDAATAQAIRLFTGRDVVILGTFIRLNTEFSGGGASSCTVQVGNTLATDELYQAVDGDIFTGATTGLREAAFSGLATAIGTRASYNCDATITSDVNVADLTAGSVTVTVLYLEV